MIKQTNKENKMKIKLNGIITKVRILNSCDIIQEGDLQTFVGWKKSDFTTYDHNVNILGRKIICSLKWEKTLAPGENVHDHYTRIYIRKE